MKIFRHTALFLSLVGAAFLASCTQKSLDLDVSQRGCRAFEIDEPSYEILSDPSCNGDSLLASYSITFHYSGNAECLERIVMEPETKVMRRDGQEIVDAAFLPQLERSGVQVTVDETKQVVTFRFDVTFQTLEDADSLNDIFIQFHCENTEGESTSPAMLHIYSECAGPPRDLTDPVFSINVRDSVIRVKLWDNAEEDGDIISVNLNGVWVLREYTLQNEPGYYNWRIDPDHDNDMILVAVNQGSISPNTCSIAINGRMSRSLDLDMSTGTVIRIF